MTNAELIPSSNLEILLTPRGSVITLWAIRENSPLNFAKLSHILFPSQQTVNETQETSALILVRATQFLARTVQSLADAGLIEVTGGDLRSMEDFANTGNVVAMFAAREQIKIAVSPRLNVVQEIFNISLSSRIHEPLDDKIVVRPDYGKPQPGNWPDVFVIMPFLDTLKSIYDENILASVRSLSLTCKRGDDFLSDEAIINEIWSAIYYSKLCIADCTGKNPNVFYEIGIAHTLGRRCILITQSVNDIPFDVRHRRMIVYDTSHDGLHKLRDTLTHAIQDELGLERDKLKEILNKLD